MAEEFVVSENGNIKISQEVIVRISAISAREVEGVASLGTSSGIGDLIGKKSSAKGVKVDMGESGTVVEIHLTVNFGVKINEVAYNVQRAVKNAVEEYAGLENITVNVFVDGIETGATTEKEEKSKEKK